MAILASCCTAAFISSGAKPYLDASPPMLTSKKYIHGTAQQARLPVDFRSEAHRIYGFDAVDLIYNGFHLVRLQMADKMDGTPAPDFRVFVRQFLRFVFAYPWIPQPIASRIRAGSTVLVTATSVISDVAAAALRRRRNAPPLVFDVLPNGQPNSYPPDGLTILPSYKSPATTTSSFATDDEPSAALIMTYSSAE